MERAMSEQKKRVLVIDDRKNFRDILALILSNELSVEVTKAADHVEGDAAITEANGSGRPFDLICSDHNTALSPQGSAEAGLQWLQTFRETDKSTPVLFLSATAEAVQKARELGADAAVFKSSASDFLDGLLEDVKRLLAAPPVRDITPDTTETERQNPPPEISL